MYDEPAHVSKCSAASAFIIIVTILCLGAIWLGLSLQKASLFGMENIQTLWSSMETVFGSDTHKACKKYYDKTDVNLSIAHLYIFLLEGHLDIMR